MKDTRLIICIDGLHASALCKEFAEKHNGKRFEYNSTVEVNDVTYHFRSLRQLRDGRTEGQRYTDVKVSEGVVYRSGEYDLDIIDKLKAEARMWKMQLIKSKEND